jgi:hypothetical protein
MGGSIRSFSGFIYKKYKIHISIESIYRWGDEYPDFCDAMSAAKSISYYFYETVGIHGMSGQLKRVVAEVVMPDGRVKRKYKSVKFEYKAWVMMMVNKFGWRKGEGEGVEVKGQSALPAPDVAQVVIELPDNGRDKDNG